MNNDEEENLKKLLIHSMKELGEIAECIAKKDSFEHWKNELGDLCAFGVQPMLKLAGIEFQYAVELGLRRRHYKVELCYVGQELWDMFRGEEHNRVKYKKYVEHIRQCEKCKKGLNIRELIDEKTLNVEKTEENK